MYRYIIRPILFLLSPESIHHLLINGLGIIFRIPGMLALVKRLYHIRNTALETDFLGLTFSSPVGLAAGFDKNACIYREFQAFGFSRSDPKFIDVASAVGRLSASIPAATTEGFR